MALLYFHKKVLCLKTIIGSKRVKRHSFDIVMRSTYRVLEILELYSLVISEVIVAYTVSLKYDCTWKIDRKKKHSSNSCKGLGHVEYIIWANSLKMLTRGTKKEVNDQALIYWCSAFIIIELICAVGCLLGIYSLNLFLPLQLLLLSAKQQFLNIKFKHLTWHLGAYGTQC